MVRGDVSAFRDLDLDVTGQMVKSSPGKITGMVLCNAAAAVRYVKFYNKATAATHSDTPVRTVMLPATSVTSLQNLTWQFSLGISIRASNAVGDSDTTATTTNDVIANIDYQ